MNDDLARKYVWHQLAMTLLLAILGLTTYISRNPIALESQIITVAAVGSVAGFVALWTRGETPDLILNVTLVLFAALRSIGYLWNADWSEPERYAGVVGIAAIWAYIALPRFLYMSARPKRDDG